MQLIGDKVVLVAIWRVMGAMNFAIYYIVKARVAIAKPTPSTRFDPHVGVY